MCGPHAAVRSIVGEMIGTHERPTVVDIEAGLEHLSRGTARHVDTLLIVVEPYFKSMETAVRIHELAREMGVPRIHAVANKLRGKEDDEQIALFLKSRGVDVFAFVPEDATVLKAERLGVGPLDVSSSSPAIDRIAELAGKMRTAGV